MIREFYLPREEGPEPTGQLIFREFDKYPGDVGNLDRDSFSPLTRWMHLRSAEFEVAYRCGVKKGIKDYEGDDAIMLFHFVTPLADKGAQVTLEDVEGIMDRMKVAVRNLTYLLASGEENIVSIMAYPPQYMIEELQQEFGFGMRRPDSI